MSLDGILPVDHPWVRVPAKKPENKSAASKDFKPDYSGSIAQAVFRDMMPGPVGGSKKKESESAYVSAPDNGYIK